MRLVQATNIINGSYADSALSWAAMRAVNWLPEVAEVDGVRTPNKYATPPGLKLLVDLQTQAPVRGLEDVEGRLFAVSGTDLFEITSGLTAINRGEIPGVGRVSMAHNQQGGASAANELAIANGLSGYVYNTDTTVLAQITDSAFEGASTFDYVDGYMSFTDPQGRWWGHSELNQATQYSSIDRYDAESAPDKIVSHIVSHREVIVWGSRTGEFFRNTGAATGTFQRVDGTEMEVGICATFARSRVDNTVCWVGNDLTVYRLNGHAPQRISTRPIEQLLSQVDPTTIFCFTWEDRGHKVFYVTSPNNFTVGFDFASGLWHARESYGLEQWRINALVRWGNRWVAGDYVNGLLYELDWNWYTENGRPMVSQCATGYTWAEQNKLLCPYAELIFDTGGQGGVGFGEASELELSGDVPDGTVDDVIDTAYVATGGIPPYSFAVISGTFPPGLTLNALTGAVTGTYTTAGSYSWTVEVTDDDGQTDTLPDTAEVEAAIVPMFVSVANQLTLQTSTDRGLSFTTTANTGAVASGTNTVDAADGKLYHWSNTADTKYSTDGTTFPFTACTGLTGFSAGLLAAIRINGETQLYTNNGIDHSYYAADGVAFTPRNFASGVSVPVADGTTIVGIQDAGAGFARSTDSGATFSFFTEAAFNAVSGLQRIIRCQDDTWVAFGRDGSGNLAIAWSADGASGTWTTMTPPTTSYCVGARVRPSDGRVLIVLSTGATYYSEDHAYSWTPGAAVTLGSPPSAGGVPGTHPSNLYHSNDAFFCIAPQGGGVNRIYRSTDGVSAWSLVYTSPAAQGIISMVEFTP